MSTEVMEELDAPELKNDDVAVVEPETVDDAEQRRAEAVQKIKAILGDKPSTETPPTKQPGEDDETLPAEGDADAAGEVDRQLMDRAMEAGLSEDLAQRLSQSGLLEESLAAMDRKAIARAGDKPDKPTPAKATSTDESGGTSQAERSGSEGDDSPSGLSDIFEDELRERDAYTQKRIDQLEAQLGRFAKVRDDQFQKWFTTKVSSIGNAELFGGDHVSGDSDAAKNRQALCDGYESLCKASGVDPYDCNEGLLRRAYPAMFPNEVFKAAQRDTVKRLRDAQGKFLTPSNASGSPPANHRKTPEDTRREVVRKIRDVLNR
jgi:hypothetical protein